MCKSNPLSLNLKIPYGQEHNHLKMLKIRVKYPVKSQPYSINIAIKTAIKKSLLKFLVTN